MRGRLREIAERTNKATSGPWEDVITDDGDLIIDLRTGGGKTGYADVLVVADMEWSAKEDHANAAFIAHAREDVSWLVARVRELEEERDYMRKCLSDLGCEDYPRWKDLFDKSPVGRTNAPLQKEEAS